MTTNKSWQEPLHAPTCCCVVTSSPTYIEGSLFPAHPCDGRKRDPFPITNGFPAVSHFGSLVRPHISIQLWRLIVLGPSGGSIGAANIGSPWQGYTRAQQIFLQLRSQGSGSICISLLLFGLGCDAAVDMVQERKLQWREKIWSCCR